MQESADRITNGQNEAPALPTQPQPAAAPLTISIPGFAIGDTVTAFPALYELAKKLPLNLWLESHQVRPLWAGPPVNMLSERPATGATRGIEIPYRFFVFSGLHMIQAWFWNLGLSVPDKLPRIPLAGETKEVIDVIISPFSSSGTAGGPHKIWPYQNWNIVIDTLLAAGLSVGICGVFSKTNDPRPLDPQFWGERSVRVLDALPLVELVGYLRATRCVVTIDNGVGHLAHLVAAPHAQIIPAHPNLHPPSWVVNHNPNAAWVYEPFVPIPGRVDVLQPQLVLALIFSVLASFHKDAYLHRNPDVAAINSDAWDHWVRYGRREGRDPGFVPNMINYGKLWKRN